MSHVPCLKVRLAVCVMGFGASVAGCALGRTGSFPMDDTARPARDTPDRFEPVAPATRLAPADTVSGNGCTSPIRDPRDGTELRLERAIAPRGDYAVPAGRYGSGANELLRVDCNTGAVIGFVRR